MGKARKRNDNNFNSDDWFPKPIRKEDRKPRTISGCNENGPNIFRVIGKFRLNNAYLAEH